MLLRPGVRMRDGAFKGLLLGMLSACAAPPEEELRAIPAAYHGSWSIDPAYCNFEGDTLDNEVFVSADAVSFRSEQHRVRAVIRTADGVKIDYFAEADANMEPPAFLMLSKDGGKLNDLWQRCPEARPG